ncbi:MAG: fibronectin type III domain-containing protein [Trueperaceae bacterium]|nr:fibronectin type III domain-containing protein [Trueperaceae bacterium]
MQQVVRARNWPRLIAGALLVVVLAACGGQPTPQGPPAPSEVSATPGPGYVVLMWEHDGVDIDSFQVYRQAAGQQDELISTRGSGSRSLVDLDARAGVDYRYSVVALAGTARSTPTAANATITPGIELYVGLNDPGTGVSFLGLLIYLFVPEEQWPVGAAMATATISGPAFDEPYSYALLDRASFDRGVRIGGVATDPVAGEYTAVVVLGSDTYTSTFTYDPDFDFEPTSEITITRAETDLVTASWAAVEGARSYSAALHYADDGTRVAGTLQVTTAEFFGFSGLNLDPEQEYTVQVVAHSWDNLAASQNRVPLRPLGYSSIGRHSDPFGVE